MNKDLQYYMSLPYKMEVIEDKCEEVPSYVIRFPELPGCLTSGENVEAAVRNAADAKENWLMAALEDGVDIPEPDATVYSGAFKIRMPKELHRMLAIKAKEQGVSMNQYCVYALTKSI